MISVPSFRLITFRTSASEDKKIKSSWNQKVEHGNIQLVTSNLNIMKILIYGAGVIGCALGHALNSKNEVTYLCRGDWKENLKNNGLVIYDSEKKKETVDNDLNLVSNPEAGEYDVAFITMQAMQTKRSLFSISQVHASRFVFVGNCFEPRDLQKSFLAFRPDAEVYFGFYSVGGKREKNKVVIANISGEFTLGHLEEELKEEEKNFFRALSHGIKRKSLHFAFMDKMESWLKYHLAFILPFACLSYALNYDLKKANGKDIREMMKAVKETYGLLEKLNYPVRPEGDDKFLKPGIYNLAIRLVIFFICKSRFGEICVSDHCRNGIEEMQYINAELLQEREKVPSYPMPAYDSLRKKSGYLK